MWLCLSGRQFEAAGGISKTVDEFIEFAASVGYKGVELRRGHASPETTDEEAGRIAGLLKQHGIRCSFITGDEPGDEASVASFKRVIDIAATIGSYAVRCGGATLDHVPQYREVADTAAERGVKIITQIHNGTAFEIVPDCVAGMKAINHPNYGIAFEASHLVMASQPEHGAEAVKTLGDHITAVSVQAYKPFDTADCYGGEIGIHGKKWGACLPGAPGSPDLLSVFEGLREIGFDGPVTVMPGSLQGGPTPEDQARVYYDTLEPLVNG
ncbi:MAG TPA: sugar phosphate isomerase/epimerase [Armatimonadota bacterium]|nr:sugar phosphate isomerase/epimerase [Armatimonadota bacterium]